MDFSWKLAEARWKQRVHAEHREFCSCGDPAQHFKPPCTTDGGDPATEGADGATEEGLDALLLDAMAEDFTEEAQ